LSVNFCSKIATIHNFSIDIYRETYSAGNLDLVVDITAQTVMVLGIQFEPAILGDPLGLCLGACLVIVRLGELLNLSCSGRNLSKLLTSVPCFKDSVQDLLIDSPAGATQHIKTVVDAVEETFLVSLLEVVVLLRAVADTHNSRLSIEVTSVVVSQPRARVDQHGEQAGVDNGTDRFLGQDL
jgi:hypothetical protein